MTCVLVLDSWADIQGQSVRRVDAVFAGCGSGKARGVGEGARIVGRGGRDADYDAGGVGQWT